VEEASSAPPHRGFAFGMSAANAMRSDVVIAGGGMVGATLALALAQGGLEVGVVDPLSRAEMEDERFDGRVAALAFASVRMLKILGVWDRLEPNAQPINDILVNETEMGRGPFPFSLHFDHREIGEPLGHIVENRHIRQALSLPVWVIRCGNRHRWGARRPLAFRRHEHHSTSRRCRGRTRLPLAGSTKHRDGRLGLRPDRHCDHGQP
jgi:choline dehydrogenase-like flavoprotein